MIYVCGSSAAIGAEKPFSTVPPAATIPVAAGRGRARVPKKSEYSRDERRTIPRTAQGHTAAKRQNYSTCTGGPHRSESLLKNCVRVRRLRTGEWLEVLIEGV